MAKSLGYKDQNKKLKQSEVIKVYTFLREEICYTLASILQTNTTNLKKLEQILMTGTKD